jgi:uncharacterized membrane protein
VSERRLATVASLLALSVFAVAAVVVRIEYSGTQDGVFLSWNLFLAWIPFVLALLVYDGSRRGAPRATLLVGGLLWLLFLPNAPYLLTDYKWLEHWHGAPVWFDVVVLSAFAWTGLALGFASLYLMHRVAARMLGVLTAWALIPVVLTLCSLGIYLGRFERWNSWDVISNPRGILVQLPEAVVAPKPIAVTVLFTGFLTLSYLVFYSFVRLGASERAEGR